MAEEKRLTPIKAIRRKCLDCSNGSAHEVKLCPVDRCPLYPYRFGTNPYIKPRELTEEQREEMRERGRALRAKQIAANAAAGESFGEI